MTISTLLRIIPTAFLALSMFIATTANAASMFNVTDLGTSYTLNQDSSGTMHSVTSGDGSQTYAFEKSPVTYDPAGSYSLVLNPSGGGYLFATSSGVKESYVVAQNGAGAIGFFVYTGGAYNDNEALGGAAVPGGLTAGIGWTISGIQSPVSDLNIHGQVVGASQPYSGSEFRQNPIFATFSADGLTSHPNATNFPDFSDNLNNYIASDLGVY